MRLDGPLRGSELIPDLLVQSSPRDPIENLALARGQATQELSQSLELLVRLPPRARAAEGPLDRGQQLVLCHWFGQKVFGAGFDDPHCRRDFAVTSQENDRQVQALFIQARLKVGAAEPRDPDIE